MGLKQGEEEGKGRWRGKGRAWVRKERLIYGCCYCLVSIIMLCVKGEICKSGMCTRKSDEVEL